MNSTVKLILYVGLIFIVISLIAGSIKKDGFTVRDAVFLSGNSAQEFEYNP